MTLLATVSVLAPGGRWPPTGNVVFKDGMLTVIGTVPLLGREGEPARMDPYTSTGSHSFTAAYAGNASDIGSSSTASALTVNPDSTSTALTFSPTVVVGQLVTLVATVSAVAPGSGHGERQHRVQGRHDGDWHGGTFRRDGEPADDLHEYG